MNRPARLVALLLGLASAAAPARAERLVLASASYGKNVIAICDAAGNVLWSRSTAGPKTGHAGHHDVQLLENGNLLYHDDWTTLVEMTLDGKVVWKYDAATQNGNRGKRVEVHAFRRLRGGLTMIAESGVGRIIEVDRDGKIHAEVKLQPGGRQFTRMVRKLDNGNYLVCAEDPGVVTEYSPKGEVAWEHTVGTRVYGAIRLRNGNTLIATGGGAGVVEVTPDHQTVWEIKDRIPGTGIELKWTTFLTELDNGHVIVGNCHAGPGNPQLFEIARDKQVVWQFNRYDVFGNGLACSQVLTDEQSALVRRRLAQQGGPTMPRKTKKEPAAASGGSTRRVCYAVAASLDGFIAGPNGEADWIVMDPEVDFNELYNRFDTLLIGRRTFEAMAKAGGGASMPGMEVFVFSRTLRPADYPRVTIVEDAAACVADLRSKPGKDLWLFGGGSLFRSLAERGLVDTVEIAVMPVLLGEGVPLMPPGPRVRLQLTGHRLYAGTGIVSLKYEVRTDKVSKRRRSR